MGLNISSPKTESWPSSGTWGFKLEKLNKRKGRVALYKKISQDNSGNTFSTVGKCGRTKHCSCMIHLHFLHTTVDLHSLHTTVDLHFLHTTVHLHSLQTTVDLHSLHTTVGLHSLHTTVDLHSLHTPVHLHSLHTIVHLHSLHSTVHIIVKWFFKTMCWRVEMTPISFWHHTSNEPYSKLVTSTLNLP